MTSTVRPGVDLDRPHRVFLGVIMSVARNTQASQRATAGFWAHSRLSRGVSRLSQLQRLFVSIRGRPHGMYTLQLFIGEAWVPLTVDDRLPHDENGRPLYSRDATSGALWVPLVEKAWAKLLPEGTTSCGSDTCRTRCAR